MEFYLKGTAFYLVYVKRQIKLDYTNAEFPIAVPSDYPLDLFERLWVVDTVERLGIDRHFKKEIKVALDYVYRYLLKRLGLDLICSLCGI